PRRTTGILGALLLVGLGAWPAPGLAGPRAAVRRAPPAAVERAPRRPKLPNSAPLRVVVGGTKMERPPVPRGLTLSRVGNEVLRWRGGSAAARARIGKISAAHLRSYGMSVEIVRAWLNFWSYEARRNP